MQPGSLIKLKKPLNTGVVLFLRAVHRDDLKNLPEVETIYTCKDIFPCECGEPRCTLEEQTTIICNGRDLGIHADFYVEVQPPQENVQSIVDGIIKQAPILV